MTEREPGFYWILDTSARHPRWEPAEWYGGWFIIGSEIAICMDGDVESIKVGERINEPDEERA